MSEHDELLDHMQDVVHAAEQQARIAAYLADHEAIVGAAVFREPGCVLVFQDDLGRSWLFKAEYDGNFYTVTARPVASMKGRPMPGDDQ